MVRGRRLLLVRSKACSDAESADHGASQHSPVHCYPELQAFGQRSGISASDDSRIEPLRHRACTDPNPRPLYHETPDSSPMATLFSGQFSRYYTARPHSRGHGPELDAGPPGLASPPGPAAAAACSRSADDVYLARVTVVVRHCADGDQHQRVCFHQNIALFLLGRPEQRAARFIAAGPDRCQFRKGRCSAPVRQESLLRSWRHNIRRRQPTNPSPPFPLEQRRRRRRGCPRHVHHAGRSLPTAGKSGQDS